MGQEESNSHCVATFPVAVTDFMYSSVFYVQLVHTHNGDHYIETDNCSIITFHTTFVIIDCKN